MLPFLVLGNKGNTLYKGADFRKAAEFVLEAKNSGENVEVKTYHKVGESVCVNRYVSAIEGGDWHTLTYFLRDEIEILNEVLNGSS